MFIYYYITQPSGITQPLGSPSSIPRERKTRQRAATPRTKTPFYAQPCRLNPKQTSKRQHIRI